MKKLPIFEEYDYQTFTKETIDTQTGTADVRARWMWNDGLDYFGCLKFFDKYKDVVMEFETPIYYEDIVAKAFLLGCSYGYAMGDDRSEIDNILKIKSAQE